MPTNDRQSDGATQLFRPEAVAAAQSQWLGSVIIAPALSRRVFTIFAAVSALALVCLLCFGEYTRRERVAGWVVPDRGLIRIYAPEASVVSGVHVADGQEVREGEVLLALSTEKQSQALGATQLQVSRQLRAQRESLATERELRKQLQQRDLATIEARLRSLRADQLARDQEMAVQQQRVALSTATYKRLEPLLKQGIIPAIQMEELEDERLERLARLKALERERATAAQERVTLEAELRALPLRHQTELEELDRGTASTDQALASSEAQRELVIVAPQSGTITALQMERGGSASPSVPLLSIIPAGSVLQAELFVPSRARGFIRTGQRVLLRYQAFPYQKFGTFGGVVTSISRASMMRDELARERAGAIAAQQGAEPVYQVRVRLDHQAVSAYGSQFPLQPGMQLDADIEIEHRRLVEWLFDPIYSLTGRRQA